MKRFTFTLMGLLLFLGGANSQTALTLDGGRSWEAKYESQTWSRGDGYAASGTAQNQGVVQFKDNNPKYSHMSNSDWVSSAAGTHTFTITIGSSDNEDCTLHIAALDQEISGDGWAGWNGSNDIRDDRIIKEEKVTVAAGATLSLSVSSGYAAIVIWQTSGNDWRKVNIASFTRTVGTSVAAPTITPASGTTYAGNLSVTITPGEGNDKVTYSVTGSNEDASHTNIDITAETTINLTGSSTITVTATGYNGVNASSPVTNTYTYSIPDGKTNVAYAIPHVVNTAKYTYTFEGGDNNVSTTGFSSTNNSSSDDSYHGNRNLWLKNDSKRNAWDSQVYIDLNSSEWPVGTKAILHFAMKSSTDFNANGGSMEIAFQQNSGGKTTICGFFSTGMVPTNEWKEYDLETTVTGDVKCEKLYFNCGQFTGQFRFDDIILYKVEEAATGGDNHFTTDDQVANIASSAFTNLTAGDYICANVTGTPETIKLVCNGSDYALTQFNGGTLWGIKATTEMVSALKANNSQFKGHDLILNGINIYKTVALGEEENSTALASKINNVFVELTRNFTGGTWNTVCLPFALTSAQANELFGSGYKLAKFTASGTNKMTFTTIDLENEGFVAGKPYLVYPTADLSHSNKVLANVSITETEGKEDEDNSGYKFKGSFEPTTFSSNLGKYRFIASGNELKTPTGGTLKSLRCYFEYPSGGNARSFTIDEEGGTTGINAVNGEGFMVNGYYNLNGQRVAKPTKGLYIVNGKKVVIK